MNYIAHHLRDQEDEPRARRCAIFTATGPQSFIRTDDAAHFLDYVIRAAEEANVYNDLVKYLLMVRQKAREPKVDGELIFAYAKIDRLSDI